MPSRVWISCWRPGQQTLKTRRSQPEHDANRCSELVTGDGTRGLLTLKFLTPGYTSAVKYCNILDQVTQEIRKLKLNSHNLLHPLSISKYPVILQCFQTRHMLLKRMAGLLGPQLLQGKKPALRYSQQDASMSACLYATLGILLNGSFVFPYFQTNSG